MRTTILAALAVLPAATAAAQDAAPPRPVALPLEAPADAAPVLADFIAVCSRAVVNLGAGITEAERRGYALSGDMPGVVAAAVGFAGLEKDADAARAFLQLNRIAFPHLLASSCALNLSAPDVALDTAPIGTIPGIEGGAMAFGDARIGRWSLIDSDGEVVTITDTQAGASLRMLGMNRAVRTGPGTRAAR